MCCREFTEWQQTHCRFTVSCKYIPAVCDLRYGAHKTHSIRNSDLSAEDLRQIILSVSLWKAQLTLGRKVLDSAHLCIAVELLASQE